MITTTWTTQTDIYLWLHSKVAVVYLWTASKNTTDIFTTVRNLIDDEGNSDNLTVISPWNQLSFIFIYFLLACIIFNKKNIIYLRKCIVLIEGLTCIFHCILDNIPSLILPPNKTPPIKSVQDIWNDYHGKYTFFKLELFQFYRLKYKTVKFVISNCKTGMANNSLHIGWLIQ